MRMQLVAALAATLLAGGSTVVLAQSGSGSSQGGQGNQSQPNQDPDFSQDQYNRNWIPGPVSPTAQNQGGNPNPSSRMWPPGPLSSGAVSQNNQNDPGQLQGQSRASQRSLLRQELREAGFRNIRILDAAFLVQASTGAGQQVIMVVDPPEQNNATTSSSSGSDQTFTNQDPSNRRQQFGSTQNSGTGANQNQLSAEIMTPGMVGQDRIRSHLRSRGFSNISGLTQDGNTYTGTADWYGEQVDFRVDGRNGFVIEPSHITPSQVRTMLSEQGWNRVDNIQQQGTSYRVHASRNGTSYNLWVDARTGEINRQTASTSGPSGNQGSGGQQ